MKIKIIAFGKTKHDFLCQAEKFYISRISPFSSITLEYLEEEKMGKTITEEQIQEREAVRALKHISHGDHIIACHPKGKHLDSPQFSKTLQHIKTSSSSIVFLIGGSMGLGKTLLETSHLKLSFSAMTFPHDLFRVFLLEQIYRAFMIETGRKYHR